MKFNKYNFYFTNFIIVYLIALLIEAVQPNVIIGVDYIAPVFIISYSIIRIILNINKITLKMYAIVTVVVLFQFTNIFINEVVFKESIKFIGVFLVLFLGIVDGHYVVCSNKAPHRIIRAKAMLLTIPFLFPILKTIIGGVGSNDFFTLIFANRNNSVFYYLSIFVYFAGTEWKYLNRLSIVIISLYFKTQGAIIAIALSYIVIYKRYKAVGAYLVILFLVIVIGSAINQHEAFNLPVLNRLSEVYNAFIIVVNAYPIKDIPFLEYGEIVRVSGSTDLSLFFRIKQWTEMVQFGLNMSVKEFLFGIGLGNISDITSTRLIAHNDYLKIFIEAGAIVFIATINMYYIVIRKIFYMERDLSWVILAILMYFFTENLLNNFLAMSMFSYGLGRMYSNSN